MTGTGTPTGVTITTTIDCEGRDHDHHGGLFDQDKEHVNIDQKRNLDLVVVVHCDVVCVASHLTDVVVIVVVIVIVVVVIHIGISGRKVVESENLQVCDSIEAHQHRGHQVVRVEAKFSWEVTIVFG